MTKGKSSRGANPKSGKLLAAVARLESKLAKRSMPPKKKKGKGTQGNFGGSPFKKGIVGSGPSVFAGRASTTDSATNKTRQIISEDEYVMDIAGAVNLSVIAVPINPGQFINHPWGSQIASLYEEYTYHYLEYYFTSMVSGFATNGQTGIVMLSADYDASDAAPTTKQQIEDTVPHTVPCLPSTSIISLKLDVAEMKKSDAKFVRSGAQPANTDIKTYDAGNLYISVQGCANTSTIGELHVRYRCELRKPTLVNVVSGSSVHFSTLSPNTSNNFLGMVAKPGGSPVLSGITLGTNVINFPVGIPGDYLVVIDLYAGTSCTCPQVTNGGVVVPLSFFSTGSLDSASSVISATSSVATSAVCLVAVKLGPTGGTMTLSPTSTITGANPSCDVFITVLPSTELTMRHCEYDDVDALTLRLERLERLLTSNGTGSSSSLIDIEECHTPLTDRDISCDPECHMLYGSCPECFHSHRSKLKSKITVVQDDSSSSSTTVGSVNSTDTPTFMDRVRKQLTVSN